MSAERKAPQRRAAKQTSSLAADTDRPSVAASEVGSDAASRERASDAPSPRVRRRDLPSRGVGRGGAALASARTPAARAAEGALCAAETISAKSGSTENARPDATDTGFSSLIAAKLETLPPVPGCYLFLGAGGEVLYVGKAKSLRARVRSYFQFGGSDARYFIPILRRAAHDLETKVTASEKEAAVLENQLIKQYRPRFNVKLRDDKEFLCLRLDPSAPWPRLETVRRPDRDGARYFGPYHSASSARRTLHLVNKHFQLRTCSDTEMASRRRACLQYQIKRCPAPCVFDVDRGWYGEQVRSVALFLDGRHDQLTSELEQKMHDAAGAMEFELAAIYRDQLRAIDAAREGQRVVSQKDADQDVVGLYREGGVVEIELMQVRKGRVLDSLSFSLRGVELPDEEVLAGFLSEYYGEVAASLPIPDEVLLPVLPDGAEGTAEWLGERRGRKVEIIAPQRGVRADLLRMATDNARHAFREKSRSADDLEARLEELREKLRLPSLPHRIECCDISHLGGGDTVGSIISLLDGQLEKKRYRSFHVQSVADGDDYGAMYEVLARRFRRGKAGANAKARIALDDARAEPALRGAGEIPPQVGDARNVAMTPDPQDAEASELDDDSPIPPDVAEAYADATVEIDDTAGAQDALGEGGEPLAQEAAAPDGEAVKNARDWELPDLFVVDGGRGQLNVALQAARDLGLHQLAIVSLAKERELKSGDKVIDRVYLPGQKNGILLRPGSSALFFLARARDEAHRFANFARKRLGKSRRLRSAIEDIPGLGPHARKALLRTLGSMAALRAAKDEEILAVEGVTRRHLAAIRAVIPAPPAGPLINH